LNVHGHQFEGSATLRPRASLARTGARFALTLTGARFALTLDLDYQVQKRKAET
jgi:hypothetical protein